MWLRAISALAVPVLFESNLPLKTTRAEILPPTTRHLEWMKQINSTLNLIEIAYQGTISYALRTTDSLQAYMPWSACCDNELACSKHHGWPLLFHQRPFEVLAVATNSSSSVPPHWNLLDSYYEKMSHEMLIDIMFSALILVRSHGKLSWV
jgi:hypothetical protein